MKKSIILLCLILNACASIPSLGPGHQQTTFQVHPDDMARFKVDQRRCYELAMVSNQGNEAVTGCLKNIGYQSETVTY